MRGRDILICGRKFVDDRTILVNELRDELLTLYSEADQSKVLEVQNFLNERAHDLAGMGYKIIRLPMPAPMFVQGMEVFRSYTNSLIVSKTAIVPNYKKPSDYVANGKDVYPDERYRPGCEREVRKTYENLGFKYQPIDSDKLIAMAGAVHCATMQIAS